MPINCSYCNQQGHNIRRCNDSNILRQYNLTKLYYIEIMRLGLNEEVAVNLFKSKVGNRFSLKDIKAIASQYSNSITSLRKETLISNIWLHLHQTMHVDPSMEPEWLEMRRLPTVPDPIPAYAQDLAEPEPEEPEEEITWYIDRNPSLIPAHLTNNPIQLPRTPIRESMTILAERLALRSLAESLQIIHRYPSPLAVGMLPDDFIPFEPRNLNEEFARVATQPTKYNIMPSLSIIETSEELEKCEDCSICLEETKLADTVTINCGHKFCGTCITSTLKMHKNIYAGPSCALCRAPMSSFVVKNPEIYNLVAEHCNL
jgi:hypothetical protein